MFSQLGSLENSKNTFMQVDWKRLYLLSKVTAAVELAICDDIGVTCLRVIGNFRVSEKMNSMVVFPADQRQ